VCLSDVLCCSQTGFARYGACRTSGAEVTLPAGKPARGGSSSRGSSSQRRTWGGGSSSWCGRQAAAEGACAWAAGGHSSDEEDLEQVQLFCSAFSGCGNETCLVNDPSAKPLDKAAVQVGNTAAGGRAGGQGGKSHVCNGGLGYGASCCLAASLSDNILLFV